MNLFLETIDYPLLTINGMVLTLRKAGVFLGLTLLLYGLTRSIERFVTKRILRRRSGGDPEIIVAGARIMRYLVLVAGWLVAMQTIGFDLSGLVVVLGTLGIGAGLALQPLLANFIGGFVLVFEKSIRVGNRIEQGGLYGDVKHIGLRTTTITTNDNVDVIVPNVTLVSSQIINWSHDDPEVRVSVGVGVDYRCDPEKVRDLLLEVARSNPHVLQSRATDVLFEGFGDSAMQFVLRCWTRSHTSRPGVLKSELNFAISRTFRKNAISIPFPQRVLHLRSGWVGGAASREDCDEL